MWRASMHAADGPASTTTPSPPLPGPRRPEERIPGEREVNTLTHREPGAMAGQFSGADIPAASPPDWLDEDTTLERVREGGGNKN